MSCKRGLLLSLFFFTCHVYSEGLLSSAENRFFDSALPSVVGIEIESVGLSVDEVVKALRTKLRGKTNVYYRPESHLNPITKQVEHFHVEEKKLLGSKIGELTIKPEDNSNDNSNTKENFEKTQVIEVVTSPISYEQVALFQEAVDLMVSYGARGTAAGFPISIQVNVEMGQGKREQIHVRDVLNILRNYLKPLHRAQIATEIPVPDIRQKYLGLYSAGMMKRLLDYSYNPSWEMFFVDFMYRQSLEVLGFENAWLIKEAEARRLLKKELVEQGFEPILPVVKWNYVRISSLFMFMFPEDWITGFLEETGWFRQYPILEFREPNNNFEVLGATRKILGLVHASLKIGEFEYIGDGAPFLPPIRCSSFLTGY